MPLSYHGAGLVSKPEVVFIVKKLESPEIRAMESRNVSLIKNNNVLSIMAIRSKGPAEEVIRGPIKSKTVFPVLVLHLLAAQPDHGSGLMQRIEALCHGLLAVNTNTIYPLLRRLEERGFIVGEWEHPIKRSRRYYRITQEGRTRLDRIKTGMLPYLDMLAGSIARLRGELYDVDATAHPRTGGAVRASVAASTAPSALA
ncbi:MAG: PadR family transcriptional regulator [Vulcanimicrobiaceae bacterium]